MKSLLSLLSLLLLALFFINLNQCLKIQLDRSQLSIASSNVNQDLNQPILNREKIQLTSINNEFADNIDTSTDSSNLNVYGMIYSPYREGRCPTQREIDQDIKLISPITSRLHLYGMDCNQTSMILSSINRLAPNMKLMIGMWVRGEGRFEIESKELKKVLDEIGYLRSKGRGMEDNIIGICVGNEELFTKSLSKMELIGMLRKVKSIVREFDLRIPVYTTEIPILWDHELAEESDAILLNIHPYFDQKLNPSKEAALRVLDQYLQFQSIYSIHNKPIIIGETGWPNGGQQVDNTGIPGFKEQEGFFKKLICLCDYYKIHYYLFEAYDSEWKEFKLFNGAEKHFGLFSKDRIRHHQLSLRAEKACV